MSYPYMLGTEPETHWDRELAPVVRKEVAAAPKNEVRYTGHGANTGGLQGHSVGDEYPYLIHGVADSWDAPTEYQVMDTRTGNRSQRFPTYMAAYIHLMGLKVRNLMHS